MFSHLFYDGTQPGLAIAVQYDPTLVFLSVTIACLLSYATLNIAGTHQRLGKKHVQASMVFGRSLVIGHWRLGDAFRWDLGAQTAIRRQL